MRKQKVKVILDKEAFLDWRWNCKTDYLDLADKIISDLRKKDKISITLQDVINRTGYIPLSMVKNAKTLPDYVLDEDKLEILNIEACSFILK